MLPDYKTILKGYVRDPEPQLPEALMSDKELRERLQFVRVASERFTVPEVLFSPSDIGINQAGIPEAITQTVKRCPPIFQRDLYSNVILGGGNSLIPGFRERIASDLLTLKPTDCSLNVTTVNQPQFAAWRGLQLFAEQSNT